MTAKTHARLLMLPVVAISLSGLFLLPTWFAQEWYWRLPSTAVQIALAWAALRVIKKQPKPI
jgi:hypothetical protein